MEQSFTFLIKEELISKEYSKEKTLALLSAFIRVNGLLVISNNKYKLILKTENNHVAKFIYNNLKILDLELGLSFSFRKKMKLNKNTEYLINVSNNVERLLEMLKINFLENRSLSNFINSEDKIKSYLAGLFLSCGSCSNPSTSNYHFEFSVKDEGFARLIFKLLGKIKKINLEFKEIKRRNSYVIYLKKSDQIVDLLAFMDAYNSCLEFENIRLDRDYANSQNRLINCDISNFKKIVEKSKEQIKMINLIDSNLGIENIVNIKIKELCLARIENPEASYQDLANILSEKLETKISKSNINHLFIKIKEMAEKYNYDKKGF